MLAVKGTWKNCNHDTYKEEGLISISKPFYEMDRKQESIKYSLEELEEIFIELGQSYGQNAFCILPQNSFNGENKPYLVHVESKRKEFFDLKESSIGGIFSTIRNRKLVENEKWVLDSVHYESHGYFGLMGRHVRLQRPLEKMTVGLNGISIKRWLEVENGQLD